jgi:hypothetical protein
VLGDDPTISARRREPYGRRRFGRAPVGEEAKPLQAARISELTSYLAEGEVDSARVEP